MRTQLIKIVVLLLSACVNLLPAQEPPKADSAEATEDIQRNIEYAKIGETSLKVDVFRPKERTQNPLPVIVWFHGGGWYGGTKEMNPWRETMFVQHDYAFVSVEYRLSTVAPFPACVEDCKSAIRWVRKNAQKFGFDPEHVGSWGYSAGGHLSLMMACTPESAGLEGKGNEGASSKVQAACSWAGPTDLKEFQHGGEGEKAVKLLLGGLPSEKVELCQKASPLTYAVKSDPPLPPILMLHGDADALVPIAQAESMLKNLTDAGANVKLVRIKNFGHGGSFDKAEPTLDSLKQTVLEFFDKALKPGGK